MKNLSKKEIEVISDLEFKKKYYFTKEDIKKHFDKKEQITKLIYHLKRKERIIKLNKNKYFLVPIKARTGKWTDNPYIIADEIFNGEDYFVGGWAAANYWKLTDQIPMQYDIWTTKRQGKTKILGVRFVFHRTTQKRIEEASSQKVENHTFRILNKEKTKKWIKLRK